MNFDNRDKVEEDRYQCQEYMTRDARHYIWVADIFTSMRAMD